MTSRMEQYLEEMFPRIYRLRWEVRGGGDAKCYISGPMTGLPYFNFPAFEKAAEYLRAAGWAVYSPRENDLEAGIEPNPEGKLTEGGPLYKDLMKRDLWQVCDSDAIFVMPGWEWSEGARLEVDVAHRVRVPVFSLLSGREIEPPPHQPHEFSSRIVQAPPSVAQVFPTGSGDRKDLPVVTGVLDYFSGALAAVAAVSKYGNDKHNPGEDLHWSRGKSNDHADAIGRHLIDRGLVDPDNGLRHSAELAWRALALLQQELEEAGETPVSRGSR